MTHRQPQTRSARQRGTALVLVLGVTSIVGVIGMSSLLAVRLQHRDVQSRADAVAAQQFADSLLQVVHTRLSEDSFWRTNHTHDVWSADEAIAVGGTFRYTLRDESDGYLADDSNDPARLVVRVAFGDAVRLASVELGGGTTLGPELVVNGDIENGSSPFGVNIGSSFVTAETGAPYAGNAFLRHSGRATSIAAWDQDLTGKFESDKTYRLSAQVRLGSSSEQVTLGLYYPRGIIIRFNEITGTANENGWTLLEGDVTPSWTSEPTEMDVYGRSSFSNQDVHIDNLSVREVLGTALPIVRGSYRRELDESTE